MKRPYTGYDHLPGNIDSVAGVRELDRLIIQRMLIWLGDCDECSERLVRYQLLAESLEIEGLKGWFVWTPKGKRQPPNMRIPVLKYQPKWRQGWMFEERPAVMLINADGRLDHLITGDLDDNYQETEQVVMRWMSQGRDYQQPE